MAGLIGFDSFANSALAVGFVTYFITVMHFEIARASNEVTNFLGVSYILSIAISYFADTVVGRYQVALISACLEFLVMLESPFCITLSMFLPLLIIIS